MAKKLTTKEILELNENFNEWLFLMSDVLEKFIFDFNIQTKIKLDFGIESVNEIEKYLLNKFESIDEILKEENKVIHDSTARYVG